jgi:hypothetical protein
MKGEVNKFLKRRPNIFTRPEIQRMKEGEYTTHSHRPTFNLSSPRNDFKLCRLESVRFAFQHKQRTIEVRTSRKPGIALRGQY